MFKLFSKSKPVGEKAVFTIDGMHCTSCSMNITGALEDTKGVIKADINYAKSQATVEYDPTKTNAAELKKAIKDAGYDADQIV